MKLSFLLLALPVATAPAHAQLFDNDKHGAYLSAQLGDGNIDGPEAIGYTRMRWRALEVRAGRDLNPHLVGEDSIEGKASSRIDFVYYNEGHPDNNHRDGFAFQFTYARTFVGGLVGEISAGPYTSMNTTTNAHLVQVDDSRHGMLYSVALRYPLDAWAHGAHLRIGYNHAPAHGAFRSDALMIGIGRHFTDAPPFPETDSERDRLWLGAAYGRSITNQSGTHGANGGTLEAKQYGGKWALSFKAIVEGDDQARVDRRGVAAQFWFVQPLTKSWSAQAGIGPYLAENRREDNRTGVHGLVTLQFERNLNPKTKAFFAFNRVKTFRESNDRDLYQLGVLRSFGP
jgi:hypothetical protein